MRAEFRLALTDEGRRHLLLGLNARARAEHLPDPDTGLCPLCAVRPPCRRLISATRALRAAGVVIPVVPPHPAARPAWWCERCAEAWPCWQARLMLGDQWADEPGRPGLAEFMRARLAEAAADLPGVPYPTLERRFLRWVS
jgi:hypothetical protein